MLRLCLIALLLTGCAGAPVVVKMQPQADLIEPVSSSRPSFIAPSDPAASSCLTPAGEDTLRALVLELMTKYQALRAWAIEEQHR